MYKHIVLFWLKEPTDDNLRLARDKLLSLAGKIEGLLSCEVGIDALGSERSCHLCLSMTFATRAALDAYRGHPAHLPVQRHMHAVRSASSSADYPIERPARRRPALYASLGPSCGTADVLEKMFDAGMTGVRLNVAHRTVAESARWIDAFHTAAARCGAAPEFFLDLGPDPSLPEKLADGVTGVFLTLPRNPVDAAALVASIPQPLKRLVKVARHEDLEALPLLLAHADEIVIARAPMGRQLPRHEIPAAQKRVAAAANALGKPFMVTDLLHTMQNQPSPTSAEVLDIYNSAQDGASSLLLAQETSIGKYAVDSMEWLRKTVDTALF